MSRVKTFKRSQTRRPPGSISRQGALWNGGVFAFRLGYVLDRAEELFGFCDYDRIYGEYENLKKISFDYAVAEKESSIEVMRFGGQ